MSISLDRLIDVIDKIKTWVLAGLAIPFVTKLATDYYAIKATGALVWLENPIFLGISGFSICLLVSKLTAAGAQRIGEWIKNRVPPFEKLADNQKQFLIDGYQTGEQKLKVERKIYKKRWLKELEEKNYIKRHSGRLVEEMDKPTSTYYITKSGYLKIATFLHKKRN